MNHPIQRKAPFRVLCLLILLSCSLILLGAGGWFFVGSAGRQISGVLQQEFAMLGLVRDITRESSVTRRHVTRVLLAASEAERASAAPLMEEASTRNTANLARFRELLNGTRMQEFEALAASREEYLAAVRSALTEIPSKSTAIETVDRLFAEYQDRQDALAGKVQDQVVAKKEQFDGRARLLSIFFIVVALWPIAVVLLPFSYLLAHTAVLFLFARRGASA